MDENTKNDGAESATAVDAAIKAVPGLNERRAERMSTEQIQREYMLQTTRAMRRLEEEAKQRERDEAEHKERLAQIAARIPEKGTLVPGPAVPGGIAVMGPATPLASFKFPPSPLEEIIRRGVRSQIRQEALLSRIADALEALVQASSTTPTPR